MTVMIGKLSLVSSTVVAIGLGIGRAVTSTAHAAAAVAVIIIIPGTIIAGYATAPFLNRTARPTKRKAQGRS